MDNKAGRAVRTLLTFAVVCLVWVFFRADSLSTAFFILKKFTALPVELAGYLRGLPAMGVVRTARMAFQLGTVDQGVAHSIPGIGLTELGLSVIFIAGLITGDFWMRDTAGTVKRAHAPLLLRWAVYYVLILALTFSINTGSSAFIYFTF